MESKSIAEPVEKRPHGAFWTCILAAYTAHQGRSFCLADRIGHSVLIIRFSQVRRGARAGVRLQVGGELELQNRNGRIVSL